MKWYDLFASKYDAFLESLYHESRRRAAEMLDLENEQYVLDVACGTGANFSHILASNPNVKIFGTDFSSGMLKKAQNRMDKNRWKNITLFQADARMLNAEIISQKIGRKMEFDRILCALGLSVVPEWEKVLDNLLLSLKVGGKIVIMDVYAEERDFNTWLVEKIARADLDRKIWQSLEGKVDNFQLEYLPVKESKVGGKLFVAVGEKNSC